MNRENEHETKLRAVLRKYDEAQEDKLTPEYSHLEMGIVVWEMSLMQKRLDKMEEEKKAIMEFCSHLIAFGQAMDDVAKATTRRVDELRRKTSESGPVHDMMQKLVDEKVKDSIEEADPPIKASMIAEALKRVMEHDCGTCDKKDNCPILTIVGGR